MTKEQREELIKRAKVEIDYTECLEKSKGKMFCCPYCGSGKGKNKSGAFAYNKKTNSFHCFACNRNADVLDLIQLDRGLDFNGALEYAAELLHYGFSYSDKKEPLKMKMPAPKQEAEIENRPLQDYNEYYNKAAEALANSEGYFYLQARGIDQETASKYKVGYDANWISPTALYKYQAGENKNKPYSSKRIIIPLNNNSYIARAIDKENSLPKIHENGGGEMALFNLSALDHSNEPIFVVEGAIDALSVIQARAKAIGLNSISYVNKFILALQQHQEIEPIKASFVICLDNEDKKQVKDALENLKMGLDKLGLNYIEGDITNGCKDANEALQQDREKFYAAVQREKARAATMMPKTDIAAFLDKIQGETYKPYKTGVKWFDSLLGGGLLKQSVCLLMAAPGAGKTTLCQQLAEAIALNKQECIYLNLEMSKEQMLAKAISSKLAYKGKFYTASDILQGYSWSQEQRADITAELEEYTTNSYPYLQYNPNGTSTDLDQLLQYLTDRGNQSKALGKDAPLVIIDYLHLISNTRGLDNQELIKQLVVGLKKYALDYNSIVIAIAATGRESNKGGRITLNSGRDSSNLEYTGDYVLGLNYKALFEKKTSAEDAADMAELQKAEPREMVLQVLKARLGQQGKSQELYYNAKYNFFYAPGEFAPINNTPFDNKKVKPKRI